MTEDLVGLDVLDVLVDLVGVVDPVDLVSKLKGYARFTYTQTMSYAQELDHFHDPNVRDAVMVYLYEQAKSQVAESAYLQDESDEHLQVYLKSLRRRCEAYQEIHFAMYGTLTRVYEL